MQVCSKFGVGLGCACVSVWRLTSARTHQSHRARAVGGRQHPDRKAQIYIGKAPAVNGRNLNRCSLRCLRRRDPPFNSLRRTLISSVTTAHLHRARKIWTAAALRIGSLIGTALIGVPSLLLTWSHLFRLEFGCNDSFQEFLIVLCLDCRSPVKAEWYSMLPEINNKVSREHF